MIIDDLEDELLSQKAREIMKKAFERHITRNNVTLLGPYRFVHRWFDDVSGEFKEVGITDAEIYEPLSGRSP